MNEDDKAKYAQDVLNIAEQGAETVWRNVLADTVLELFERDGTVSRTSLKDEVIERISDDSRNRIERATYKGALKALDGNPPS